MDININSFINKNNSIQQYTKYKSQPITLQLPRIQNMPNIRSHLFVHNYHQQLPHIKNHFNEFYANYFI